MQMFWPALRTIGQRVVHFRASGKCIRTFSDTLSPREHNLFSPNSSVDHLLNQASVLTPKDCKYAVDLVLLLSQKTTSIREIEGDERFIKILSVFETKQIDKVSSRATVACLKVLEGLENQDLFSLKSLENNLLWRSRSAHMRDLVFMLSFAYGRREKMKQLLQEVIKSIERRWVEVTDAQDMVGILHYSELFSKQFVNRLDDRIIEMTDTMKASELVLILSKKGEKMDRSVPLLKSLVYHLKDKTNELNVKEISDALFALNQLSFKDIGVIMALCDNFNVQDEGAFSIIRSTLTSVGRLKCLHPGLMDNVTSWMSSRVDEMCQKDLVTYLLTTATLNYIPNGSEGIYKVINKRLSYESLANEMIWLDVVWSLAVLNKHNQEQLASVLTSEFYNKLLYSLNHRNVGIMLKVLNLNAVASFLTPDFKGPVITFEEDPLLKDVKAASHHKKTKLIDLVTGAFSNLATPPRMSRLNINTGFGFVCDIECVFDAQMKPVPIESVTFFDNKTQNKAPLPSNQQRLAVFILDFHDCLLNGSLSGLAALNKRILESQGFKVMVVTHNDIKPSTLKLDRVKKLEKKLQHVLKQ